MDGVLPSNMKHWTHDDWKAHLNDDTSPQDRDYYLQAFLRLLLETKDVSLLHILSQYVNLRLLRSHEAQNISRVIAELPDSMRKEATTIILEHCELTSSHVISFCCCLLEAQCNDREMQELSAEKISRHLQTFARELGNHLLPEAFGTDDLAKILRLLLVGNSLNSILSPMQCFVLEYAVFLRYPDVLPDAIEHIFADYDQARHDDDQSKSLAQLCEETQGTATSTMTAGYRIFSRSGITNEDQRLNNHVADLIITLISSRPAQMWNWARLGRVIGELLPNVRWNKVIELLDASALETSSLADLDALITIILAAVRSSRLPIEISELWSTWKSHKKQADMILFLASFKSEQFTFTDFSGKKVLQVEDFVAAPAMTKNVVATLEALSWNSLNLLQSSLALLEVEDVAPTIKTMLEWAAKQTPELIFLGCIQLPHPWSAQQEKLCEKGFEVFFRGQPNSGLVFFRLWQVDPEFMCRKFIEYYSLDSMSIVRILDIGTELGILEQLLNLQPYTFTLDLASSAGERDLLNLEKWVDHQITAGRESFIESSLRYLSAKAEAENALQQSNTRSAIKLFAPRVDSIAVYLKALMNSAMSLDNTEFLKQVQIACLQVYPRLMSSTTSSRKLSETNCFPKDVEREVEYYYGRLYEGDMSISRFIEMLQSLKGSSNSKDQDIFACMLHSLFDEYRFFADYPESALNITAVLFGSLIQNQLLSYIPLGIALRYVLDAAAQDHGTSMFRFGVKALHHFRERVPEWPQYCQQILAMPSLIQHVPDLLASIRSHEELVVGQNQPLRSFPPPESRTQSRDDRSPFFTSFHSKYVDNNLTCEAPSDEDSDTILFNINNMSLTNLTEKTNEVRKVLRTEHVQWFARHLVSQRAAIEPNYHTLYLHFLMSMELDLLMHSVVDETISNIARLLNSESTVSSTVDRGSLKNLGSWLGLLTLSRDVPLKHKDISLKDLLLEGYDGNRLIVVLPFVCRVIEQTMHSKVLSLPNPWTTGVISLLKELYDHADMKLNLKFEVEVLCKKLVVELQNVPTTTILTSRPTQKLYRDLGRLTSAPEPAFNPPGPRILNSDNESMLSFLLPAVAEMNIVIHPMASQLLPLPNLRSVMISAIERSLSEYILPVVERSVAVASISTSQLISKDFALEEDLNKFRSAAHSMNRTLAGSLALVTCREPLRTALNASIRFAASQQGIELSNPEHDGAVAQLINDNIDEICTIVEQAAMERAVKEIDDGLASGYQTRIKFREMAPEHSFVDSGAPRHTYMLPDPLRLRRSGLTVEQLNTYNDFARVPRTAFDASLYYSRDEQAREVKIDIDATHQVADQSLTIYNRLMTIFDDLDTSARDANIVDIHDLSSNSMILTSLQTVDSLLANLGGPTRDDRILLCSQRVCQLMFRPPYNELAVQILTLVLHSLVDSSLKTYRDVSIWLMHSEDSRKYNVPIIVSILQAQIILPIEFDIQLAKQVMQNKNAVLEFAIALMTLVKTDRIMNVQRTNFLATLEAFHQNTFSRSIDEDHMAAWTSTEPLHDISFRLTLGDYDHSILVERLLGVFDEWTQLMAHPAHSPRNQLAFFVQLERLGVLDSSFHMIVLMRAMLEHGFQASLSETSTVSALITDPLFVVDCACQFVLELQKLNSNSRAIQCLINLVILIYASEHDIQRAAATQKAVVRTFSNILQAIHAGMFSESVRSDILDEISQALATLQPSHFPHFTFGWLSIVSHRLFVPSYLSTKTTESWPKYSKLLTNFLSSMSPLWSSDVTTESAKALYQGFLRILLVLLNDFPGLLDEHYHSFMNVIPYAVLILMLISSSGNVQLRNLVLSAFPKNMSLPDPFLPGLKVDRLPESSNPPRVHGDLEAVLSTGKVLPHVHSYVHAINTASLQKLSKSLQCSDTGALDTELINTLVLHCGSQAMGSSTSPPVFDVSSPWVSLLHELFKLLSPQGRYQMLNAIANQLRYPNRHTYFFSCVVLFFFSNGTENDALSREQITRVLLERLICNRPHPWGLLITFTELLKNPKYGFWDLKFIRSSPEIETLFHSLFNHINQNISLSE